jgi:hypothetical protein
LRDYAATRLLKELRGRPFELSRLNKPEEDSVQTFISRIIVIALVPAAQLLVDEAGAQTVQESVTGHAEFVIPLGNHVRFSLSAIRHRDGSVSGEVEEHVETQTGVFVRRRHGTVICFTVNGNIARIGAVSDRVTGPNVLPPGAEFFFTVVDNGEGANEELLDLASALSPGSPGTAVAHCTIGLPRTLFPVSGGNIQVRSSGL